MQIATRRVTRSSAGEEPTHEYAGNGNHRIFLIAMHYSAGKTETDTLRIQSMLDHFDVSTFSIAQREGAQVGYAQGNISTRIPYCALNPHVIILDYFWQQAEYYRRKNRYNNDVCAPITI